MLRLATAVSLSTIASAQVDFNWTSTGYEPTTDVSVHEMLGQKFLEFKGLVEPDDQPSDWDNAIIAYNTDVDAGDDVVSLATIGEMYGDVATNVEFEKFRRFHGGNSEYADHFVTQALSDAFHPRLPLSDDTQGVAMVNLPEVRNATSAQRGGPEGIATKSRQELTMKGLALQSLMMGMINHLYKAHDSCLQNEVSSQYVDQAWVLWYGGGKGPFALGNKRCVQFGTCINADGDSAVNEAVLNAFTDAQDAAGNGDCSTMLTKIQDTIVPQAFVPVIQGLFREAWEVDEVMIGEHFGADGFVEQIEGWAFMMAVIPRIDSCNETVADIVLENVQIRTSETDPRMVKDGFQTVIAAVEGTFSCLGVTCSDLNTMYREADRALPQPADTACPLWETCENGGDLPRAASAVLPTCEVESEEESEVESPEPTKASGTIQNSVTIGISVLATSVVFLC